MTDILTVRSLSSGYKKNIIIHDISFSIEEGKTLGLIGLNGAGKTTLIKSITGLIPNYSGEIIKKQDHLSYLPEKFEPPFFLTGREYINFSLKSYNRSNISQADIYAAAAMVSLDQSVFDKRIKTYSKGMRQKLGVLAVYLTGCSFTVLDEPMSGLDPKAHVEVKSLIKKMKQENRSIFMSVHNLHDLEELCDEVLFMNQGRICFYGSVAGLLKQGNDKSIETAFLNILKES